MLPLPSRAPRPLSMLAFRRRAHSEANGFKLGIETLRLPAFRSGGTSLAPLGSYRCATLPAERTNVHLGHHRNHCRVALQAQASRLHQPFQRSASHGRPLPDLPAGREGQHGLLRSVMCTRIRSLPQHQNRPRRRAIARLHGSVA